MATPSEGLTQQQSGIVIDAAPSSFASLPPRSGMFGVLMDPNAGAGRIAIADDLPGITHSSRRSGRHATRDPYTCFNPLGNSAADPQDLRPWSAEVFTYDPAIEEL